MATVIKGLAETQKALRQLTPDLKKSMDARIKVALSAIVQDAKKSVPSDIPGLTNWMGERRETSHAKKQRELNSAFGVASSGFPAYNSRDVKMGIKAKTSLGKDTRTGFRTAYAIRNESKSGAIIETAGRKSGAQGSSKSKSRNPHAGEHFIAAINAKMGNLEKLDAPVGFQIKRKEFGRLIYKATNRNMGRARTEVLRAIRDAEEAFNAKTKG